MLDKRLYKLKPRKKILINSIVFSPDAVSTAYLYNDIALGFKEKGYEIVVLTTTPHYNRIEEELIRQPLSKKCFGLYYESRFSGILVLHIPQKKHSSAIVRCLYMIYWHIVALILGLIQKDIDLILTPSPPITIGLVSILIAKIKKAKTIYNVQEIYPDLLINHKGIKSSFIIKPLRFIERLVYNNSDAVVTIDEVFYNAIKDRIKIKSKLYVIPNFVDIDIYNTLNSSKLCLSKIDYPDAGGLKLMYAGNIGYAQEWQTILRLAKDFNDGSVEIWIEGEGVLKKNILEEVKAFGLQNIHILPYQTRDKMPAITSFADLHFIFMEPKLQEQGFPSKIYTIMACAKPLIISSGVNTPLFNFFKNLDCAFIITADSLDERYEELKKIIVSLLKNPEAIKRKGLKSFALINAKYCKKIVIPKFISLVDSMIK